MLSAGAQAPSVSGADQNGVERALAGEQGRAYVVYFYPKDGTPGCTTEACAFRDAWARYQGAQVDVFGVSDDDQKSHATFAKEQNLPFPIIADTAHAWGDAFGVKSGLFGYSRVTFLVGKDGKITKVYPDVDPGVHAAEVLRDAAQAP